MIKLFGGLNGYNELMRHAVTLADKTPLKASLLNQLSASEIQRDKADDMTIVRLRDSIKEAERVEDHGAAGDAAFNLATLLSLQGQDDEADFAC